jgi:hypothetical protein
MDAATSPNKSSLLLFALERESEAEERAPLI